MIVPFRHPPRYQLRAMWVLFVRGGPLFCDTSLAINFELCGCFCWTKNTVSNSHVKHKKHIGNQWLQLQILPGPISNRIQMKKQIGNHALQLQSLPGLISNRL